MGSLRCELLRTNADPSGGLTCPVIDAPFCSADAFHAISVRDHACSKARAGTDKSSLRQNGSAIRSSQRTGARESVCGRTRKTRTKPTMGALEDSPLVRCRLNTGPCAFFTY